MVKASSFEEMLSLIKNNKADFFELIDLCRSVHSLVFDYNTIHAFDDDDKEKLAGLEDEINSSQKQVVEKIKTAFDCGSLELTAKAVFNEIVMPLSEVEDK